MKAYSPVNRTWSPRHGFLLKSNITEVEYNTKHTHFTNVKVTYFICIPIVRKSGKKKSGELNGPKAEKDQIERATDSFGA